MAVIWPSGWASGTIWTDQDGFPDRNPPVMKLKTLTGVVIPALAMQHRGDPDGLKSAIVSLTRGEDSDPITDEDGNPVEIDEVALIGAATRQDDDEEEPADEEEMERTISTAVEKAVSAAFASNGSSRPKPQPQKNPDSYTVPATARVQKSTVFDDDRRAYGFGLSIIHQATGSEKALDWLTGAGWAPVSAKALGEGVSGAGGVLVHPEFSADMIRLVETYGKARTSCRMQSMGSDTLTVPRKVSEGAAVWLGENQSLTEADDTYDSVTGVAKKLGRITRIASELMEDSAISVADDVATSMAQKFAQGEDAAWILGDGTSTYGGIWGINAKFVDGTHTAGILTAATGNTSFGEIELVDYHGAVGLLPEYALPGAKWYCSQSCFSNSMQRLSAAAGGSTWQDMASGGGRSFLGYPVEIVQTLYNAVAASVNTVFGYFGDMGLSSTFFDRRSLTMATSTERYFDSDQVAIRGIERVDIVNHDLGDTSTVGPIVALRFPGS